MRSSAELWFRLRQETANVRMLLLPPGLGRLPEAPAGLLPDVAAVAARLRGTPYAAEVERLAEGILRHRFPLLGLEVETGPAIRWRRDAVHGVETGTPYFRRVPYLDFAQAGDHKVVWELNRHQHLVLLAQAWRLTGRDEFPREVWAQLAGWLAQNPFQRGINWASALEVAFRALSWLWVYHLAGAAMPDELRRPFLTALYHHGRHLERNLSVYFSPNTHLLGEAVALHALGSAFPDFPGAARWTAIGARIVEQQMDAQVHADGSHNEQSSYYHVYALDMFLFHAAVARVPESYRAKLARMADYLAALLEPDGSLPLVGDDDGGRFFHPYGERPAFGRATLATAAALLGGPWPHRPEDVPEQAAWWLGESAWAVPPPGDAPAVSRLFPDAGMAIMAAGGRRVRVDAGGFGPGRAGHSHADTLSLGAVAGGEELLVDPGTFTYVTNPAWRDRFRGTALHNTVRIDGLDQGEPAGPFAWSARPVVELLEWRSEPAADCLEAVCRYRGFTHRRRVVFRKPDTVLVADEIDGPAGEHTVEQFWHPATAVRRGPACFRIGREALLAVDAQAEVEAGEAGEYGWRSVAFGVKSAAPVVRVRRRGTLPLRLEAVLHFGPVGSPRE